MGADTCGKPLILLLWSHEQDLRFLSRETVIFLRKPQQKVLRTKYELHVKIFLTCKFWQKIIFCKNHLIDLTNGCQCSDKVDGYATGILLFWFCFGTSCSYIMLAMATGETISFCLVRWHKAVLSLSFFDVYGAQAENTKHRHPMGWK